MKTQKDLEQQIVQDIVSNQSGSPIVTLFRIGGVVRAIATSVSGVLADIMNDALQFKRSKTLDTCPDDSLEATIGNERGVPQNGPSQSSAIVLFSGPDGTVIPEGYTLQTSGIAQVVNFTTTTAITLNAANPGIPGLKSVGFGNGVLCMSNITGSQANVPANTIQVLSPAITGVTCTNPLPAKGATDEEDPSVYRERIRDYVNIMAQGTEAFYEAVAQNFDQTVLRAYASYNATTNGTTVSVLKNDGSAFDSGTLTDMATAIAALQRATEPTTCVNVTMTGLTISVNTQFEAGTDAATGYANIANALCDFLDWTKWGFGTTVQYADLADVINNAPGVAYIDLSTLVVNGTLKDISISASSLPRLAALSITTIDTIVTVNYSLMQTYSGV